VTDACVALGVGIRRFPDRDGLRDRVRITLPGDPDDFARLEHVLATALAPDALLFDLDGVLVDVGGSYRRAIVDTAASFGVVVSQHDIETAKSSGGASDDWELTRRLIADRGVVVDYREVTARFELLYQGNGTEPGLKANERPLVDASVWARWAQTLPLAVVTGRPRVDAEEVLDRFGLLSNTSVLVTREDAPLKPDPAPILLALERLAVEHAWMVGDTRDDIEAARSAGVLPIGVAPPGANPLAAKALTPAARTLDRTHDLEELLP
jgi:HAD superfamily phosphatase